MKLERHGAVALLRIKGDPRHPEPQHVRIDFPGGDVDVTRSSDGSYWVHVRVNRPDDGQFIPDQTVPGVIVAGRLDFHGAEPHLLPAGPALYHVAVRVRADNGRTTS